MGNLKKVFIILVATLILMQFYNPNDNHFTSEASQNDFLEMMLPPEHVKNKIKASCYDCHSNNTNYPWYSHVAPISYLINHHVEEAKEHLNFSEWGLLSTSEKNHKLEEIMEEIEGREMPLWSYRIFHSHADISNPDKQQILNWIDQLASVIDFEEKAE